MLLALETYDWLPIPTRSVSEGPLRAMSGNDVQNFATQSLANRLVALIPTLCVSEERLGVVQKRQSLANASGGINPVPR